MLSQVDIRQGLHLRAEVFDNLRYAKVVVLAQGLRVERNVPHQDGERSRMNVVGSLLAEMEGITAIVVQNLPNQFPALRLLDNVKKQFFQSRQCRT